MIKLKHGYRLAPITTLSDMRLWHPSIDLITWYGNIIHVPKAIYCLKDDDRRLMFNIVGYDQRKRVFRLEGYDRRDLIFGGAVFTRHPDEDKDMAVETFIHSILLLDHKSKDWKECWTQIEDPAGILAAFFEIGGASDV